MEVGRRRSWRSRSFAKSSIPQQRGRSRAWGHYKRIQARKNWTNLRRKYRSWRGNRLRANFRNRQLAVARPYLQRRLGTDMARKISGYL